jgi:hypothetical protein
MPWGFAYAPRGPVARDWDPALIGSFHAPRRATLAAGRRPDQPPPDRSRDRGRRTGRSGRRVPPGAAGDGLATGTADPAQCDADHRSRADEDALWDDLRKKWRQYVNKARKAGITVVDGDGSRLGDFYRIYRETRTGRGS